MFLIGFCERLRKNLATTYLVLTLVRLDIALRRRLRQDANAVVMRYIKKIM